MIKHYPYNQLGKANHGWLNTRHHFSFAHYYNPSRTEFGALRVINDDTVAPHTGFPPHPHRNMEIISFVRSGALSHEDNLGNKGVTRAGEVQVMSAGTGIVHAEYNRTKETMQFFQIWIEPNKSNVKPRWATKPFPKHSMNNALTLLVSGDDNDQDALFIHQNAKIYGGVLTQDAEITQAIEQQAYLVLSKGEITLTGLSGEKVQMHAGDGAEITSLKSVSITANQESEIVLIDVPN